MSRNRNEQVEQLLGDTTRSGGGWMRVNCPFCPAKLGKTDRKRALAVNSYHGGWVCWRCGTSGKLKNPPDAFAVPLEAKAEGPIVMAPPDGYLPLYQGDGATARSLAPARDYLRGRGVTADLWEAAHIGACLKGKYARRVVVPILPAEGTHWLGYVTREWYDGGDRPYLNASGMERLTLYNHKALLQASQEPVLVVEGVFDALAYWPDAVAVLGKPTDAQMDALAHARRPVVMVLDGDAHYEAWALMAQLRVRRQRAGWVKLPPGLDPDEMDRQELRRMARESLDKAL